MLTKEEFEEKWCFTKHNVEPSEYRVHQMVYNAGIVNVPKIYSYDENEKILVMQKICNMSVADFYGEDIINVPHKILNDIQRQIKKLYEFGVCYPDITGYNFVEKDGKVFIVNFRNACFNKEDAFVEKFIHTQMCNWNPEYL